MTTQIDTATEVVRAFSELAAVSLSRQQQMWIGSLILDGWTADRLLVYCRYNSIDFDQTQCSALIAAVQSAADRTEIQRW